MKHLITLSLIFLSFTLLAQQKPDGYRYFTFLNSELTDSAMTSSCIYTYDNNGNTIKEIVTYDDDTYYVTYSTYDANNHITATLTLDQNKDTLIYRTWVYDYTKKKCTQTFTFEGQEGSITSWGVEDFDKTLPTEEFIGADLFVCDSVQIDIVMNMDGMTINGMNGYFHKNNQQLVDSIGFIIYVEMMPGVPIPMQALSFLFTYNANKDITKFVTRISAGATTEDMVVVDYVYNNNLLYSKTVSYPSEMFDMADAEKEVYFYTNDGNPLYTDVYVVDIESEDPEFVLDGRKWYIYGETAVKEQTVENLVCYPNPTNGQVSINSEVATQIYVYDLCGRQIMNTTIEEGYNVIDISHLANGCYLMKTGNNKVVKLIKR